MPSNAKNEDLRITKTVKALNDALFSQLELQSFKKVTVKDLCESALTSRATFYTHFIDKYELLKYCLAHSALMNFNNYSTYEEIGEAVNSFIQKNKRLISNLLYEADAETLAILSDVLLTTVNIIPKDIDIKSNPKYAVLSNFFAGGMISYLLWQVDTKFLVEPNFMNAQVYEIIKQCQEWGAE